MPRLTRRLPKMSHHRASGRAVVTFDGRDHYLGPWGSKVAQAEFKRLLAEYVANGNVLPEKHSRHFVAELAVAFRQYATSHYVDEDGAQTGEAANFDAPLRVLLARCTAMQTGEFSVADLKAIQSQLASGSLSRREVNRRVKPKGVTYAAWVAQLRQVDPERCALIEAWDSQHRFYPYQLRHAAATRWRITQTPDVVLTLLGDRSTNMVDVYVKRDRQAAFRAVRGIASI